MADATANCLRLLKLMPFADLEKNMFYLSNFVDPDELVARVDVPLAVATDTVAGEKFLTCDYNRDADSYRSPHTNQYFPPLEDDGEEPLLPEPELRAKETLANEIFSYYVLQYYGRSALSSCYFFDVDGPGFGACWLVKKTVEATGDTEGCVWDSKHIFEVRPGETSTKYKLQSNIILTLKVGSEESGSMQLGGHVQKTHSSDAKARDDEDHIGNMGRLLEKSETQARGDIDSLYLGKMHHILGSVRSRDGTANVKRGNALQTDLATFLKGAGARK